jgi:hypothetical protein
MRGQGNTLRHTRIHRKTGGSTGFCAEVDELGQLMSGRGEEAFQEQPLIVLLIHFSFL